MAMIDNHASVWCFAVGPERMVLGGTFLLVIHFLVTNQHGHDTLLCSAQ